MRICGRTDPFMAVSFTQHLFPAGTIAATALPMTPDTSPFPVSKSGIRFLPANSVPRRLARHNIAECLRTRPVGDDGIDPCAVASRTACNFVFIPPRPRREPAPPAIAYTPSSMHSIRESSRASECRRGSLSYSPSISEKITSRFALREKKPLRSPSGHFCTTSSETGGRHSQTSRKNIACCRHGKNRLPAGETGNRNTDTPEGLFCMKPEIHSPVEISSLFRSVAVSVTFSCR